MPHAAAPYLTYKLDVLKTIASKAADEHYRAATGLRIRELRVLRLIHEKPGIAATELKNLLVLDKALISKHITELEQRQLVQRQIDPSDSRVHSLTLTAEGEQVWKRCEDIGRELEHAMFAALSAKKQKQLHELLDTAYASLQAWQAQQK